MIRLKKFVGESWDVEVNEVCIGTITRVKYPGHRPSLWFFMHWEDMQREPLDVDGDKVTDALYAVVQLLGDQADEAESESGSDESESESESDSESESESGDDLATVQAQFARSAADIRTFVLNARGAVADVREAAEYVARTFRGVDPDEGLS